MQVSNVMPPARNSESVRTSGVLNGDAFLTLLVAQLRSQNPFQPMDPAVFVGQLVQFNLLEQTIQIRQALERNGGGQEPTQPASPLAAKL